MLNAGHNIPQDICILSVMDNERINRYLNVSDNITWGICILSVRNNVSPDIWILNVKDNVSPDIWMLNVEDTYKKFKGGAHDCIQGCPLFYYIKANIAL